MTCDALYHDFHSGDSEVSHLGESVDTNIDRIESIQWRELNYEVHGY